MNTMQKKKKKKNEIIYAVFQANYEILLLNYSYLVAMFETI